jgi:hypothetical protein
MRWSELAARSTLLSHHLSSTTTTTTTTGSETMPKKRGYNASKLSANSAKKAPSKQHVFS